MYESPLIMNMNEGEGNASMAERVEDDNEMGRSSCGGVHTLYSLSVTTI